MTLSGLFSLSYAREQDSRDELAAFREEFVEMDPGLIYLDGNSLGRLPVRTIRTVRDALVEQWGERLVRAWGESWVDAPRRIGDKIGRLVGAAEGQALVADSTSVNLFKLVSAALVLQPQKTTVLSDALNFPSDVYVMQGCCQASGRALRVIPEAGDPTAAALEALDENTALVSLSLVAFKSGYLYDAQAITRKAHALGVLVLWDLCHAAGAVPVDLDAWDADFAVGCTYKYLNAGPGSPAFLYVNKRMQTDALSPIWGWWGESSPFAFDLDYHPAQGVSRFMAGSPPVLSLLPVEPGVDLLLEAGMRRVREKSIRQTEYLIALFDEFLAPLGFILGSPRDAERRGSHVSIRHAEGYRINRALIEEMAVIPDFREPDNIRLGIAPLYTRYQDIYEAVQRIARVVEEGRYKHYPEARLSVT